ncbi:MAG: YggT family protein [Helicobacteraceae bacterium]|jgi:YggT family protein|nr:YggT family protein [Helicobacteraceae bacterium]
MSVLSRIVEAFAIILGQVISIYCLVIIAAALISWVRPDPYNPIVQILYRLTEPVYALLRRFIRTSFQGVDIAPIIVLLALQFINLSFVRLLMDFAYALGK